MKYTFSIIFFLITSCASSPKVNQPNVPLSDASALTGTWAGLYECRQGVTGLTLEIKGVSSGLVEGTFLFYPATQEASSATGKYIVRGSFNSERKLILGPGAWLERPDNYYAVGLRGTVNESHTQFVGIVPECGNKAVKLNKQDKT